MYRYIRIFYITSSLTCITYSMEWDSPVCLTCNENAAITKAQIDTSAVKAGNDTESPTFRVSSSSSSTESDTSDDDDETDVTTVGTTAVTIPTTDSTSTTRDLTTKNEDYEDDFTNQLLQDKNNKKKEPITIRGNESTFRVPPVNSYKESLIPKKMDNQEKEKETEKRVAQTDKSPKIFEFGNQLVEWYKQLENKGLPDYEINLKTNQDHLSNKIDPKIEYSSGSGNQLQNNTHEIDEKQKADESSITKLSNLTQSDYTEKKSITEVTLQDRSDKVGIQIRSKHKHKKTKQNDFFSSDEIAKQKKHKHKKDKVNSGQNIDDENEQFYKHKKKSINSYGESGDDTDKIEKYDSHKQKTEESIENHIDAENFGKPKRHEKNKAKKPHGHKTSDKTRDEHRQKKHHTEKQTSQQYEDESDDVETTTHKTKKTKSIEDNEEKSENIVHEMLTQQKQRNKTRYGDHDSNKNINSTKFHDIPFSPHKIKDNNLINSFTKQILLRTLRLFNNVEKNNTDFQWKTKVKRLAKTYEHKFKEFLTTSAHHNIKTKLGTQKVILNAIDMSKQIVNRLLNVIGGGIDKSGLLRTSETQDVIHKELKKEVESELHHACSKLGVCDTQNGFIQIVLDVLSKMLSLNDKRFRQAFDSLTDVVEFTDFSQTLGKDIDARLKRKIKSIEEEDVKTQRAMVKIMRNILSNRNKPLILYSDTNPKSSNINGTLAFLEVIDVLDKAVPMNDVNINEWREMKNNMTKWSNGVSIQPTVNKFVKYIEKTIGGLDEKNKIIVMKNIAKIF